MSYLDRGIVQLQSFLAILFDMWPITASTNTLTTRKSLRDQGRLRHLDVNPVLWTQLINHIIMLENSLFIAYSLLLGISLGFSLRAVCNIDKDFAPYTCTTD